MAGDGAGAGEGGAADDEGPGGGGDGQEGGVGGLEDLVAEQVVHVVLLDAGVVRSVGADGVHGQVALDVVEDVGWVVDVAHAGGRGGA